MWICFTWVGLLWLPWIYTEKTDVTFVLGDWLGDWLTGPFLPAAARSSIVNLKDWFSPAGMEHWVDGSTHWRDGDERRPRWRRSLHKFPAYVDWTLPAEEFKWSEFHFTKWSSLLYCKNKHSTCIPYSACQMEHHPQQMAQSRRGGLTCTWRHRTCTWSDYDHVPPSGRPGLGTSSSWNETIHTSKLNLIHVNP